MDDGPSVVKCNQIKSCHLHATFLPTPPPSPLEQEDAVAETGLAAVSWFLLAILRADLEGAREDDALLSLAAALADRRAPGSRQLGVVLRGPAGGGVQRRRQLGEEEEEEEPLSLEDVLEAGGGRHGNDFADFRSIGVMAMLEEVCEFGSQAEVQACGSPITKNCKVGAGSTSKNLWLRVYG